MSLENMKKRIDFHGGVTSDGRNVRGKFLSFKSALNNSYHAEWITFKNNKFRCLINPDKLKENYDQKEISIAFDANMGVGDVFYWDRTEAYWLAYMTRYEEEAYFRAQIRRCDYYIDVNDNRYWVYLRGPVETALIWRQKHQIEINELNYSILFYITRNDETEEFFQRFRIVKFGGHNWRVEAVDRYSQDGLIEVYIQEYFDNSMEDEVIIPEIVEPDRTVTYIDGPQIVRPYNDQDIYTIVGAENGEFWIESSKARILEHDSSTCRVEILSSRSGEFVLEYKIEGQESIKLPITIKSL